MLLIKLFNFTFHTLVVRDENERDWREKTKVYSDAEEEGQVDLLCAGVGDDIASTAWTA